MWKIIALASGCKFKVLTVLPPTFMTVAAESIVTFTFSFFLLETIHRKYTLPKFFPEGHLNRIEGLKQPSVKLLFFVKYISIYVRTSPLLNSSALIGLCSTVAIGFIINLSFTSYFDKPLKSLKKHVEKIKEGDYQSHVKIVTNDALVSKRCYKESLSYEDSLGREFLKCRPELEALYDSF